MTTQQSRPDLVRIGAAKSAHDSKAILGDAGSSWRECAERAMTWYIDSGLPFAADDLAALGVPEPDRSGRWGALFSGFRSRGLIELVGYQPSRRKCRHGEPTRVWRGVA